MYCEECGKELKGLKDDDIFCWYCGAPIGKSDHVVSNISKTTKNLDYERVEKPKIAGTFGRKFGRPFVAFIVVILIGSSIIYLFNNNKNDSYSNINKNDISSNSIPHTDSTSNLMVSDDFSGSTLDPGWIVNNENSDSKLLLSDGLKMMVSSNEVRITRPVDGDWILETKVDFSPTNDYQRSGVILCFDESLKDCASLERLFDSQNGGSLVSIFNKNFHYENNIAYFRIRKSGNNYTGWISSDGTRWQTTNRLTGKPAKHVGLFTIQATNGDTNIYSKFYYFNIARIYCTNGECSWNNPFTSAGSNSCNTNCKKTPPTVTTTTNSKNNKFDITLGMDSGLLVVNSVTLSNSNPGPGDSLTVTVDWRSTSCPSCVVKANAFGDWDMQEITRFYNGLNSGGIETFNLTVPDTQGNYNIRLIWAFDIGEFSNYDSTNLPSASQVSSWGDSRSGVLDIPFSVTGATKQTIPVQAPGSITLSVGETANIGSKYMLTANSIDAKTSPRQVWLVLSKNGVKLDDKVANEGDIYTYTIKPNDQIVFKAKIAEIFQGSTSDMVTFTDISYI